MTKRLSKLAGLLLAVTTILSCGRSDRTVAPNLLVITLDTTRADYIGCYGATDARTPVLDELATEGAIFRQNASASQCTNPSHASILTGLHPVRHTVYDNATPLPLTAHTLAERCQEAGYRTLGAVSARHLDPHNSNFDQGFDEFLGCEPVEITAGQRNETFLPALRQIAGGERPFMAWVHYFDPHSLYSPPAPWDSLHAVRDDFAPMAPRRSMEIPGDEKSRPFVDPDRYIALYKGEISYVDHEIGRVLAVLDDLEITENTLVVVVADHGESLTDHEIYFCHAGMYESVMHVPLLMRWPTGIRPGTDVQVRTSSVDILPTVLDLLRLPADDELAGVSLVETLKHPDRPVHQAIYAEAVDGVIRTVYADNYKFMKPYPSDWALEQPQLHLLSADPAEADDLAEPQSDRRRELEDMLEGWLAAEQARALPAVEDHALDEETEKALRTLGYID